MADLGPTVNALILLIPGLGAIVGMGIWVGKIATKTDANAREVEGQRQKIHDLSNAHMAFREQVAKEYVSIEAMGLLEAKLISAIERLGDRLDRLFESRNG